MPNSAKPSYNPRDILLRLRREGSVLASTSRLETNVPQDDSIESLNSSPKETRLEKLQLPLKVTQGPVGPTTLQTVAELQFELAKAHASLAHKEIEIGELSAENQRLRAELLQSKAENEERMILENEKVSDNMKLLSVTDYAAEEKGLVKQKVNSSSQGRNAKTISKYEEVSTLLTPGSMFGSNRDVESIFDAGNEESLQGRSSSVMSVSNDAFRMASDLLSPKDAEVMTQHRYQLSNESQSSVSSLTVQDTRSEVVSESEEPVQLDVPVPQRRSRKLRNSIYDPPASLKERPPFLGPGSNPSAKSHHYSKKNPEGAFLHIPRHVRARNRQVPADQKPHLSVDLFDD